MSFDLTSTHAAELERRIVPVSFADARYPYASRVTRREWHLLLQIWERLQPYADRFATAFFDTLFARSPESVRLFGGASLDAQFLQFAQLLTELVSAHGDPVELRRRIEGVVVRFSGARSPAGLEDAIRAAITAMLDQVSASGMPQEMRSSWKSAYISLAVTLRTAARRTDRELAQAA